MLLEFYLLFCFYIFLVAYVVKINPYPLRETQDMRLLSLLKLPEFPTSDNESFSCPFTPQPNKKTMPDFWPVLSAWFNERHCSRD